MCPSWTSRARQTWPTAHGLGCRRAEWQAQAGAPLECRRFLAQVLLQRLARQRLQRTHQLLRPRLLKGAWQGCRDSARTSRSAHHSNPKSVRSMDVPQLHMALPAPSMLAAEQMQMASRALPQHSAVGGLTSTANSASSSSSARKGSVSGSSARYSSDRRPTSC